MKCKYCNRQIPTKIRGSVGNDKFICLCGAMLIWGVKPKDDAWFTPLELGKLIELQEKQK